MVVWRIRLYVAIPCVRFGGALSLFWALSEFHIFPFFRNHKFWVANWQIFDVAVFFLFLVIFVRTKTKPISIEFVEQRKLHNEQRKV
jgi:hypothetical protein